MYNCEADDEKLTTSNTLTTIYYRNEGRHINLTYLPLDKMATILADDIFKCIFVNENDRISIRISLKFVPNESR